MRIQNIQALRAAAAIAVVLHHIGQNLGRGSPALLSVFSLGEAGVDLFFVISGFIMVTITPKRLDSRPSYFRFLYHRITRIYPPLWIVLIPLVGLLFWRPEVLTRDPSQYPSLLPSLFLLPQKTLPLLTVSWTLIHEVYFYLVVSLALIFGTAGRNLFGWGWVIFIVCGELLLGRSNFYSIPFLTLIFSPFSLTFLLGYFLGLYRDALVRLPVPLQAIVFLIGLIALVFFKTAWHPQAWAGLYPNNNHILRFAEFGIPMSLVVAGAVGLERCFQMSNRFVQLLGDSSYSLYLIHYSLISLVYRVIGRHLHGLGSQWTFAFLLFMTVLLLAVGMHMVVERPIIRFARVLVEGTRPDKTSVVAGA